MKQPTPTDAPANPWHATAEEERMPDGTTAWVVRVTDWLGRQHVLRSRAEWTELEAQFQRELLEGQSHV